MALAKYNEKRNFNTTPEPAGRRAEKSNFRFVIQRHNASRLHYDFRLELNGVLKSWAVPKGPSLNPADKRLAMMVEDHPVSYINFEGTIPEGNYGAGAVEVWDSGAYTPVNEKHEKLTEKEAIAALRKGEFKFDIQGSKLQGEYVLVQLKKAEKSNSWLLIKHRDEFAVDGNYSSEDFAPGKVKARATKKPTTSKKKSVSGKNKVKSQERP